MHQNLVTVLIFQIGGYQKGGCIELLDEIKGMIAHQVKLGEVKDSSTVILKYAGDGTQLTKKETVTVNTITLSNEEKALSISTISMYIGGEEYQVGESVNLTKIDRKKLY